VVGSRSGIGANTGAMFLRLADRAVSSRPRIVALIPAHDEEDGIGGAIESLLAQSRRPDEIIVISDNSTDRTVEIARRYPVTVLETRARMHPPHSALAAAGCCWERNTHRKSGALNMGWRTCQDADIIIGMDGDTVLPRFAVEHWEAEFRANPVLAGSSSQPVMAGDGYLPRMQRWEFTKSATQSLARGWCRVVSGTGCAFRNAALREVARSRGQEGPWTYESVVEDYHLTYQLRCLGWLCEMSRTVYCYTGSMTTLKALWHQRIKWTAGTVGDLLRFGCNRRNYREWFQQATMFVNLAFWVIWLSLNVTLAAAGTFRMLWWWQVLTILFAGIEIFHVRRMRNHAWRFDWKDMVLSALLIHLMVYSWLSMAWGLASWWKVLRAKMGDLWAPQYKAEGMAQETEMKIGIGS
jgi:biofilm PGA synthesis N-glycosyltransferase PgaC